MPARKPRNLFAERRAKGPRNLFAEQRASEESNVLFDPTGQPLVDAPLAAAAGFNVGLAEAVPMTAGAIAGGKIGGILGAFGGPAAPVTVPLGIILGGLGGAAAGLLAADPIREGLADIGIGFDSLEDVPEELRPFAAGGRTVGQSVPFAAVPSLLARLGIKGPQLLQPILESARTAPGTFAAVEATSATGAGAGRFAAEQLAPGDEAIGTTAEIVGGILSPTALLGKGLKGANNFLSRIAGSFSQAGREQNAANALRRGVETNREDVGAIIVRLTEPEDIPGARPTSGQKVSSPALLALENNLTKKIANLDNRIKESTTDTLEAFNRAFDEAVEGGDAVLVRQISQERERLFGSLIAARVATAEQRAAETVGRIQPRGPRARQSVSVRNALEDALKDARKAERGLWSELPRDLPIEPRGLDDSFQGVRGELLEEELLPAPVEAFLKRVQRSFEPLKADADGVFPEPEIITSGDLLRFRSRVLDLQRNARSGATPDLGLARRLGLLADGALDDLAELPGTDTARSFSRQLNKLFTKGEVGNLLGFDARGDVRVAPELTLQEGIGTGGLAGDVASRQIESAAQLEGLPSGMGLTRRSTLTEQEDFVRELLVKAVDPKTGQVNARQLARLTNNNRELLERFPVLAQNVTDANAAQLALEATARLQGKSIKAVRQQAAFARVAKFEDPVRGIGDVLNSNTPLRGYREIAKNAKKSGREAVAGLRQATFSHLLNAADGMPGTKLRNLLNARSGKRTLLETMTSTGVLSSQQKRNLTRIIDRTEKLEQAIALGRNLDEIFPDPSALETLLIRVVGARIGAKGAAGAASGASLIAASSGSKFLRNLVQKIPTARTIDIIEKAVEDPIFMAKLLNKGKTTKSQSRLEKALNEFMDDSKLGKTARIVRRLGNFAFPPDQANAFLLQTAIPGTDEPESSP